MGVLRAAEKGPSLRCAPAEIGYARGGKPEQISAVAAARWISLVGVLGAP